MERLFVIKIGGNIIDDETKLQSFLKDFSAISEKKILVHGGGKLATKMAGQLGIEQQMIEGRRITDAETLKIVTMVYAGLINKKHRCATTGSWLQCSWVKWAGWKCDFVTQTSS